MPSKIWNTEFHHSLASLLDEPKTSEVYDKLSQATQSNNAIPMLIHSWAEDPLLFKKPEAQKQILTIQKKALLRDSDLLPQKKWIVSYR